MAPPPPKGPDVRREGAEGAEDLKSPMWFPTPYPEGSEDLKSPVCFSTNSCGTRKRAAGGGRCRGMRLQAEGSFPIPRDLLLEDRLHLQPSDSEDRSGVFRLCRTYMAVLHELGNKPSRRVNVPKLNTAPTLLHRLHPDHDGTCHTLRPGPGCPSDYPIFPAFLISLTPRDLRRPAICWGEKLMLLDFQERFPVQGRLQSINIYGHLLDFLADEHITPFSTTHIPIPIGTPTKASPAQWK
ncbi:Voltage-dependent calcium channel type A subunit alpha-1 [Frankliniella fusca]|uniref:Voltage-dependent calcium channel type A subunit alpha-1 n=1 Tax=Frankliniella fusca TaxID=407009 RepID=A0AAE1LL45_9NEOP|nr:Voltage-dependent calcium channel type A subunit alpha-1 [Frankliniella fusca]